MRVLCGTLSGYTTHRRKNEDACSACKEAKRVYGKNWRLANPEIQKKIEVRQYASNKQKCLESGKRYRAKYPEKSKLRNAKYHAEHPEVLRISKRTRRARIYSAGSEPYTTQQILDLYGTNCHICLNPIDLSAPRHAGDEDWENGLHLDHVIPLSLGGADLIENVKPSHAKCNLSKPKKAVA